MIGNKFLWIFYIIVFSFILILGVNTKQETSKTNPYILHEIVVFCAKNMSKVVLGKYEKDCSFGHDSCKQGKLMIEEVKKDCSFN